MYTIWFSQEEDEDLPNLFMSRIPTRELAERIAANLIEEGFVRKAWVGPE